MEEKGQEKVSETKEFLPVSHWVTKFENTPGLNNDTINYLNSMMGPLKSNKENYVKLDNDVFEALQAVLSNETTPTNTCDIIFKIDEKIFIETIDIYEKSIDESSLLKIEAKQIKENNGFSKIIDFFCFD